MVPVQRVRARRSGFSVQREVRPSRRTSALKERTKESKKENTSGSHRCAAKAPEWFILAADPELLSSSPTRGP